MRYWTHWHNIRYELNKRLDNVCLAIARRLPGRFRMWVAVDSTVQARNLFPAPGGYSGPDGLEYAHIYRGALRKDFKDG